MESARNVISDMKIRGSWGILGNQDVNDYYPYINTYALTSKYPFDDKIQSGAAMTENKIRNISWETTTTWGVAVDATLFNDLSVTVEYYNKKTTGILMKVNVPATYGYGGYWDNVGAMLNTGVELQLNYRKAFGEFQAMLADIPQQLGETIPDFHNMELRARQLEEAVAADPVGRCAEKEVQEILAEMRLSMDEMCKAERMHREGLLPKRICHCDTKVNNMMFDKDGSVLCVIDLDTVMPSFVFSDYGDFLRTGANKVAEDCPEIDKVEFDMDIFRAFTRGYLESASVFLTPVEKENLPYAAALFPFMQAVRFFADYINGDTYYRTAYPDHNLVRTRNQMALFRSVISRRQEMADFCGSL